MDLKSIDLQEWLEWFAKNKDAFEAVSVILGILGILLIVPLLWGIKWLLKWVRSPAPTPNKDNPTSAVGYTIEKHQAILKSRETQLRQDLTAASTAEKQVIQLQLDSVKKELVDLTASYEVAVQENVRLKSELAAFAEYIPGNEITRAQSALENGDRSTADAILKSAEEPYQNVTGTSAPMAYLRGEIAEGEIRLQDALDHYERAYGQDPTFDHLQAYARLCWEMGRWRDAVPLRQKILNQVRRTAGNRGQSMQMR